MYSITFYSQSEADLQLLQKLAERFGNVCINQPSCLDNHPEYQLGLEEGLLQGMEQGLIEGMERGAINKAYELARFMKNLGYDEAQISSITHLLSEDVAGL